MMEAVRIGGLAREEAADDGGLSGRRRQGEGEDKACEAYRIDGASGRGDRGNRWILADDDIVAPPPDPTSPRGRVVEEDYDDSVQSGTPQDLGTD